MKWDLSLYHVYCVVLCVLIDRLLIWQHVDKDTFTTGFSLLKYLLKQAYTTIQITSFYFSKDVSNAQRSCKNTKEQ